MAPRHIASLLLFLFIFSLSAHAQTYVGTLQQDGYSQHKVSIRLAKTAQGDVQMTLFHVKFARMMPVRLDVVIPGLKLAGGRLTGDNSVPLAKGKRYEKYTIRQLAGTADANKLEYTCIMGSKKISFKGKIKQQKK